MTENAARNGTTAKGIAEDAVAPSIARDRKRWMLHIDEPTRAALVGWLTDVIKSLARIRAPCWSATALGKIELDVPRGVRIRGRRRDARLSLTEDALEMLVVDTRPFSVLPLQICGDRPEPRRSTVPTAAALEILTFWREGLSAPNDETRIADRERFGLEVRALLAGVGARLPTPWKRVEVFLWVSMRHEIRVWVDGHAQSFVFAPPGSSRSAAQMSEALAEELELRAKEWTHVSEMISRHFDELPVVQIGPPDYYAIRSEDFGDPIERLRAAAATRDDLRIIWPSEGSAADL